MRWVLVLVFLLQITACRPSGLCEAPRRSSPSGSCPAGCREVPLLRDDGQCYRPDTAMCLTGDFVLGSGGSCMVDPDGVRHAARYTGYQDLLETLGWRPCSAEELEGFPTAVCSDVP